jgi:hypothetical protein
MEFRAPSLLGKRPRGYVPDDVAARRGGRAGGGSDDDASGDEAAPATGTERAVQAALKAEAARKADKQKGEGAPGKKSVTFAEPQDDDEEGASGAIKEARRSSLSCPLSVHARCCAARSAVAATGLTCALHARRARWRRRPPSARCSGAAPKARRTCCRRVCRRNLNCH